jgi:hypothetical protein
LLPAGARECPRPRGGARSRWRAAGAAARRGLGLSFGILNWNRLGPLVSGGHAHHAGARARQLPVQRVEPPARPPVSAPSARFFASPFTANHAICPAQHRPIRPPCRIRPLPASLKPFLFESLPALPAGPRPRCTKRPKRLRAHWSPVRVPFDSLLSSVRVPFESRHLRSSPVTSGYAPPGASRAALPWRLAARSRRAVRHKGATGAGAGPPCPAAGPATVIQKYRPIPESNPDLRWARISNL